MTVNRKQLEHNVLRNALYHTARRRFFECWNRVFNFFVIILGTSVAASLFSRFGIEQMWFGLVTTVIGAMQLVFDFGGKACEHQSFQRDYYRILAEIESVENSEPEQLRKWRSAMIDLTADETPTLRAIDAKAYNDALAAIEIPDEYDIEGQRLYIPWWQRRFLGHCLSFEGYEYKKMCERKARKKAG